MASKLLNLELDNVPPSFVYLHTYKTAVIIALPKNSVERLSYFSHKNRNSCQRVLEILANVMKDRGRKE